MLVLLSKILSSTWCVGLTISSGIEMLPVFELQVCSKHTKLLVT